MKEMSITKRRINTFCRRYGLDYQWQQLRYGFERAVISCDDRDVYSALIRATKRMEGVDVEFWACGIGVFEGNVYLMDAEDSCELKRLLKEEADRVEDWWQRYHVADAETRRLMACGAVK